MAPIDDDDISRTMISFGQTEAPGAADLGHYLVAIEGNEPGRIIEIGAQPLSIGRDAKQGVVFQDSELSRLHARVTLAKTGVVVEDLNSTNGTFVDGLRVTRPVRLKENGVLSLGRQFLKYERRDRRQVERSLELSRDLLKASNYVMSLLPAPLDSGPIKASWRYLPSTQLGGDAFGYYWLDGDTFVLYLMDVCGHGVGAAMHSVTVMNVLRQRALPSVDFANPAAVLSSLNDRFQMDSHDGMYFTIWYGVYHVSTRTMAFSSAGHHPAYVVPADRTRIEAMDLPDLMIGAMPDVTYGVREATIAPGSSVYLFSDGVFEIVTKSQAQWGMSHFLPLLVEPPIPGTSEPDRLYRTVRHHAASALLDDDFSLVAVEFQ